MRRGEIYRVHRPTNDPKAFRSYVVVSRQALIQSKFPSVICAPVFSRGHGAMSQVAIGIDEGMKHDSWILCDNLVSVSKWQLTSFVGSLQAEKLAELDRALKLALAMN
ncbi:MAG TPA: type II toxin-antitoxin system PemK/MazF family toxin [Verrucomicrobiae bacterium]|nr:type II toxin-antitoxin system PemK/MazF family toxin [Verrucomicrobiae bacterium]